MKEGTIEILDLDFEYKLWKNKLAFIRTEIELLQDRVHVLTREQPGWEMDKTHRLFLETHMESARSLENKIRTQEQEMAFYAEDYPISLNHSHYVIHEKIRKEMDKVSFRHGEMLENIYPGLCYPLSSAENSI